MSDTPQPERPRWLELERIISLSEAEQLTSLSHDTLRRQYPNLIKNLSPRRVGMKLRDALAIASGE